MPLMNSRKASFCALEPLIELLVTLSRSSESRRRATTPVMSRDFLFRDGEGDRRELLQEQFVRLSFFPGEFAIADRFSRIARSPEPDLSDLCFVGENEEVFRREWCDGFLELLPPIGRGI